MDEQDHKTTRACIYGFVLLIFGFIGSCQVTNYRIVSAIEAGAPPIGASCAFNSDSIARCQLVTAAEAEATRNKRGPP